MEGRCRACAGATEPRTVSAMWRHISPISPLISPVSHRLSNAAPVLVAHTEADLVRQGLGLGSGLGSGSRLGLGLGLGLGVGLDAEAHEEDVLREQQALQHALARRLLLAVARVVGPGQYDRVRTRHRPV